MSGHGIIRRKIHTKRNDICENQYHDLDKFLDDVDLVVIMVGHDEIKINQDKLAGKVVFDTRNVCTLDDIYRL